MCLRRWPRTATPRLCLDGRVSACEEERGTFFAASRLAVLRWRRNSQTAQPDDVYGSCRVARRRGTILHYHHLPSQTCELVPGTNSCPASSPRQIGSISASEYLLADSHQLTSRLMARFFILSDSSSRSLEPWDSLLLMFGPRHCFLLAAEYAVGVLCLLLAAICATS